MGMAASQARFLQLTARKTNLEYMGQQINQERLALANESAGLFERQLTLAPPTPPSSLDDKYYSPGYQFEDGDGLTKNISWQSAADINAAVTAGNPPAATTFNVSYLNTATGATGAIASGINYTALFTAADSAINEENTQAGTGNFVGVTIDDELQAILDAIDISPKADTTHVVVRHVDVTHTAYQPDGTRATVTESFPAALEFDNEERLINVIPLDERLQLAMGSTPANWAAFNGNVTGVSGNIGGEDLTYSAQFDENAFNDDMNEYEYKKATYDYEIERINLETERVQKQDKSLELKMKQIDTEHKAISTEIDAVQKVIQKGIDSTFKTFS